MDKFDVEALFEVNYTDEYYDKHNLYKLEEFTRTLSHSENGSDGYTLSYDGKSDAETIGLLKSGNFDGDVAVSYGGKSTTLHISIDSTCELKIEKNSAGDYIVKGKHTDDADWFDAPVYTDQTGSGYYFTEKGKTDKLTSDEVKVLLGGGGSVDVEVWYVDPETKKTLQAGTINREFSGSARTVLDEDGDGNQLSVMGDYYTIVYDTAGNVLIPRENEAYESVPRWNDTDKCGYYFLTPSGEKLEEKGIIEYLEVNYGTTVDIMMISKAGEEPVHAGYVISSYENITALYQIDSETDPVCYTMDPYYEIIVKTDNPMTEKDTVQADYFDYNNNAKPGRYSTSGTGYYFSDESENGEKMDWSTALEKMLAGEIDKIYCFFYDKQSDYLDCCGVLKIQADKREIYKSDLELGKVGFGQKYIYTLNMPDDPNKDFWYSKHVDIDPYSQSTGEGYYLWDPVADKQIPGTIQDAFEDLENEKYSSVLVYYHEGGGAFSVSDAEYVGKLMKNNKYLSEENKFVKENGDYIVYNRVKNEYGYQNIHDSDFVFVCYYGLFEKQEPYDYDTKTGYCFKFYDDNTAFARTYSQAVEMMKSGERDEFLVRCYGKGVNNPTLSFGTGTMACQQTGVKASYSGSENRFEIGSLNVEALFNISYTNTLDAYAVHDIASMDTFTRTLSHSENGSEGYTLSYNGKSDAETMQMLASGHFDGDVVVSYSGMSATVHISIDSSFSLKVDKNSAGYTVKVKHARDTSWSDASVYTEQTKYGYYFTEKGKTDRLTSDNVNALLAGGGSAEIEVWYKDTPDDEAVLAGTIKREFADKARVICERDGQGNYLAVKGKYHTVVYDASGNILIKGEDPSYENVSKWNGKYGYYFLAPSGAIMNEAEAFDYLSINYGSSVQIMMKNSEGGTPVEAGIASSVFTNLVHMVFYGEENKPVNTAINGNYMGQVMSYNVDDPDDAMVYGKVFGYNHAELSDGATKTGYYFIDRNKNKVDWSTVLKQLKSGVLTEAEGYYYDKTSGNEIFAGTAKLRDYSISISKGEELGVKESYQVVLESDDGTYNGDVYYDYPVVKPYSTEAGEGYYLWDPDTGREISGTVQSAFEDLEKGKYNSVSVYYHIGDSAFSVSSDRLIGNLLKGDTYLSMENKLEYENGEYVVYNNEETEYGYKNNGGEYVVCDYYRQYRKQQPYDYSSGKGYYYTFNDAEGKKHARTYSEAVDMLKSGERTDFYVRSCGLYKADKTNKSFGTGIMQAETTGVSASYTGSSEDFEITGLNVNAAFNVRYIDSVYSGHNIDSMFTFTRTMSHSENGSDGYTLSYNGKSDAETMQMLSSGNFDGYVTVSYGGQSTSVYIKIKKAVSYDESIMAANDPNGFVFILNSNGEFEVKGSRGTSTDIVVPSQFRGGYWKEVPNKWDGTQVTFNNIAYEYVEESPDTVHKITTVNSLSSSIDIGSVTSITFGEGIEKIGDNFLSNSNAYYMPNLEKLVIPDSVKYIGNNAFQNLSSSYELVLGSNIEYIGDYAFQNNGNATGNIVIPDTVTYLGNEAFSNFGSSAGNKGTLTIDGGMYKDGSYTVPSNCFRYSSFNNVTIGGNISIIEDNAFQSSGNLTGNLTIGASVSKIGEGAFQYTNFNGVLTVENVDESTILFVIKRSDISVGNNAFVGTNFSKLRCSSNVKSKLDSHSEYAGGLKWNTIKPFGDQKLPSHEEI